MAQWIKMLADKPDKYRSVPGSHMLERENKLRSCLLASTGVHSHANTRACTHTHMHAFMCAHTHVIMYTHTERERELNTKKN